MQHRGPRPGIRRGWVIAGSLAALVAGWGCHRDPRAIEPAPGDNRGSSSVDSVLSPSAHEGETPAPEMPPPPPAEPSPAFVSVDACSGSLAACESAPTVPCTVHCATRADGCEVSSEFVPLGTVDSNYFFRFGPIDPAGEWVFYAREWGGGRYDWTPYRWSVGEGAVLLSEALGVPPTSENHESLLVRKVAVGGTAILLLRVGPIESESYVWTRDAGLTMLDFEATDMSADGRVVTGLLGRDAVIWDRERGLRALGGGVLEEASAPDGGVLEEASAPDGGVPAFSATGFRATGVTLSDTGELAFARGLVGGLDGYGFRWSEAQGMVPFEALPGFPAGAQVTIADPNGPVLWASTGDAFGPEPQRLWRWTEGEGARALGTLPLLPADTGYQAGMSLADGQVVVGIARTMTDLGAVAFRWSSELGMLRISDAGNSFAYYANPDGTTIVGYVTNAGSVLSSFRWTAQSGASGIPGDVRGGIAFGGDLLLANVWDGMRSETRVLKYDSALANGGALPIDIIEAGLLPEGQELDSIKAISDNARLLAGTARDAEGTIHAWLLRLHDTCSP